MDNSKDYIVRYNIQTNADNAVAGLNSLSETVSAIIEPLNGIKTQLSDLYKSLNSLKTIDNMKITPQLDTTQFNKDMDSLLSRATATAEKINQMLRGAVTGKTSTSSGKTRNFKVGDFDSLEKLDAQIKYTKDEINRLSELIGTVNAEGIAPKQVRTKIKGEEYNNYKKQSDDYISDLKSLAKVREEFVKEQERVRLAAAKSHPGSLLSVETINAWKENFGDEKSRTLTMTLNGDASDAIKAIESVKKKLEELNPAAKFEINPTMNLEGFAKAEQKLKGLAQLSNAVVAPFAPTNSVEKKASHKKLTGNEKRQLEEAKANLDILNEEKQKIEKRLDKNALKYSQSPNSSLKGWVTRDTKTLEELKRKEAEYQATISRFGEKVEKPVMSAATAARQMFIDITGNISKFEVTGKVPTIMVEAKLLTDNLFSALKSMPTPTIDVNLRVNANSMLEQVRALTGGAVPGGDIESELKKKTKLQDKSHNNEKSPLRKGLESKQNAGAPMVIDVMARFVGFVEQVTATIPASVNIDKAKLLEDLKSIKVPTLHADIKLNVKGLNEQLSNALSQKGGSAAKATDIDANRELYNRLLHFRGAEDIKKWLSPKQQAEFDKNDEFLGTTGYTLDGYKNLLEEANKKYNYNKAKVHQQNIEKYTKWIEKLEGKRENARTQIKKLKAISYNNEKEQVKKDIAASVPSGNIPEITDDVKGRFTGLLDANIEPLTVDVKFSSVQVAKALELIPKQFVDLNVRFSQTQAMEALKSIQMPVIDIATRLNMDGIAEQAKQISNLQNITDKKPAKKKLTAKQIDQEVEKITPDGRTDDHFRKWLSGNDLKQFDKVSALNREWNTKNKEWGDAVRQKAAELKEAYEAKNGPDLFLKHNDFEEKARKAVKNHAPDKNTFMPEYLKLRELSINNEKQDLRDRLTRESLEGAVKQSPVKSVVELDAKLNTSRISKQIKEMPRLSIPLAVKLMWSGGAVGKQQQLKSITEGIKPIPIKLDTSPAVQALNELILLIQSKSPQNIKINASGSASESAKKEANRAIKKSAVQNEVVQQANRMPISKSDWIVKESIRAAELRGMAEDAAHAFSNLTPYEKKLRKSEAAESLARHKRLRDKLEAGAFNAALPFAENKEQAKMMVKYRKFFKNAAIAGDYDLSPDMDASTKYRYLQDVSELMRKSNTSIPWQLQSQINKIGKKLEREDLLGVGGGGGGRGVPVDQRSFFDKSRKWAFPFTGPTSFGSNTPMAVEMTKGMGAAYAIEGAMSVIGGSFGQAVDYQNIMKTTQAILQNGTDSYSNNAFNAMESTVRNVGIKTKFSAPEVADAAKFLAMAGYDINAINNAIRPIADLALIGDSDLGETADKMTNIMTTFQIAPEKMREAANIMATTAMRSNTDLMMLAESAKYGGGVANLYGKKDPNLFADTMALFGVMGNAGIQASSAGTALRMMYQNIFNPNNKQKALLEQMKKDYGITTLDENGGYRAMSDILIDIAEKVPENKMADIVGKLFRITAQPGANAALLAAANGDENLAAANAKKIDEIADKMSTKAGISSLVSLMQANRDSANGNISGIIADEKQNTIHGLWAQVSSTFTEAILRAFEARKDEFESMLRGLRDYFAKPETLRTIQVFLDAIVDIGKTMAWFAQIWAKMYTMAPNLIAAWIKAQLFFTQVGALMSPFVSLIGVVSRLKELFVNIAGYQSAQAAGGVSKYAAAALETKEKFGTPFMIPGTNGKKSVKVTGGAAMRAQQAMRDNAVLAAELALSGADRNDILEKLNGETRDHYAEVKRRANKRYGFARSLRAFEAARKTSAIPVIVSALAGLKAMLVSVSTTVLSALGALLSPLGFIAIAVTGAAGAFYWAYNKINGTFEDQIVLTQKISDKFAETTEFALKKTQWYQEELDKMKQKPTSFTTPEISKEEKDYNERVGKFRGEFGDIPNMVDGLESKPGLDNAVVQYRKKVDNDTLAKLALGGKYDEFVGKGLYDENKSWNPIFALFDTDRYVDPVVQKMSRASLYMAAKDDKALPSVHARLMELYEKHGDTQKFIEEANKIRDVIADKDNPIWESADGLSLEQFNNIGDPTRFKEYHEGMWNILDAMIRGVSGTVIGKKKAYETLKKGVPQYTPQWFGAIQNVIGDVGIKFNTLNEKGKPFNNIPVQMRMNDGLLDSQYVFEQLQAGIDGYKGNVRDLVQIFIMAYKQIAKLGGNEDTPMGALEFLNRQMQNYNVTKDDAKYFYHNFMPDWVKENNISLERYQNLMAGDFGWIKIGDKEYNRKEEIPNMMAKLLDKMVRDYYILPKAKQTTERLGEVKIPFRPDADSTIKKVQVPNPIQNTDENDKDKNKNEPYKNHYRSQAPRPTQITFNINELVHFDRTTVAANAEEKHLMESMESKITEVVYKIFAEAANQAHTLIGAQY